MDYRTALETLTRLYIISKESMCTDQAMALKIACECLSDRIKQKEKED